MRLFSVYLCLIAYNKKNNNLGENSKKLQCSYSKIIIFLLINCLDLLTANAGVGEELRSKATPPLPHAQKRAWNILLSRGVNSTQL